MPTIQRPKIPVLRTAIRLYAKILGDPMAHIRLGAPFLVVLVALQVVFIVLASALHQKFDESPPPSAVFASVIVFVGFLLATAWTSILYAVRWHRYVLLGETAHRLQDLLPRRRDWHYLGYLLLICLLLLLFTIPFLVVYGAAVHPAIRAFYGGSDLYIYLFHFDEFRLTVAAAFIIAVCVPPALFSARWALVLPGRALDDRMTMARSVDMTRGHRWRIGWLIVLMTFPLLILQEVVVIAADPGVTATETAGFVWTPALITAIISSLFLLISIALGQSAMSEAYRYLALGRIWGSEVDAQSRVDSPPGFGRVGVGTWRRRRPTMGEGLGIVFASVFSRPLDLLRAGWWVVVLPGATLVALDLLTDAAGGGAGRSALVPASLIYVAVLVVACAIFAVRWHRIGVRGVRPGDSALPTLSRSVGPYLTTACFTLVLPVALVALFLYLLSVLSNPAESSPSGGLRALIYVCGVVVLLFSFTCACPALTCRAMGSSHGVADSIEATRGCRGGLFVMTAVTIPPLLILGLSASSLRRWIFSQETDVFDILAVVGIHAALVPLLALPLSVSTYAYTCLIPPGRPQTSA